MSRPLRIEYPGACYHVTARGNGGQAVFTGADDGRRFLDLLGREAAQQRWRCHGWCLMETHYHLLLETPEPNLGRGMGRLNMAYSQWFGRRHARPGHLFAGRYRAVLFEKERWLLPLARHVVRNPVRLGLVRRAAQWHWSSHGAVTGDGPPWFDADDILAALAAGGGDGAADWDGYVAAGDDAPSPWASLRGGQYLGGEAFLAAVKERIRGLPLDQVSRAAARPDRPTADAVLAAVAAASGVPLGTVLDRRRAPEPCRAAAYLLRRACNLPLRETAILTGVTPARVSQIQRTVEDAGGLARLYPWAAALDGLLTG